MEKFKECDVISSETPVLNEGFNIGLGAMYGPLVVHMPPATLHRTFVSAF